MSRGFSYAIDYNREIAIDRANLEECDRCDRVNALVPVFATLRPMGYLIQDLLATCSDLDYAAAVAEALGVSLEVLAAAGTDTDDDTFWALSQAFEAAHGRRPWYGSGFRDWSFFGVSTPAETKAARKKAKADLARHTRNQAKHG